MNESDALDTELENRIALRNSHARLLESLNRALLWTDPEYDVAEWRNEARMAAGAAKIL